MARRGAWMPQYPQTSRNIFALFRKSRNTFCALRLTLILLFFCLILHFYCRFYDDINSALLDRETKVKFYEFENDWQENYGQAKPKIPIFPFTPKSNNFNKTVARNLSRKENYYLFNLKYKTIQNGKNIHEIENQINSQEKQSLTSRGIVDDFQTQWLRYSKAGLDWKGILNPCQNDMAWKKKGNLGIMNRSSGNTSEVFSLDIRPAGEFSRIYIRSRTADGRRKTIGGDSWRVYVRGPSSLVAKVFDYGNGTYEAMFLVMEPGVYEVIIILDYSLCDGLRDPPGDWFIKDFLLSPSPSLCPTSCRYLWNGYGRWINRTWVPYFQEPFHWHNYPHTSPSGTLWVYGDSVAMIFVQSMKQRTMCDNLYKQCKLSYNWIYPILSGHKRAIEEYDDLDFDEERVLKSIRDILSDPAMDSNSTLLLNLGLHFVMTINFTTYQKLIDHVIDMLTEKKPGSKNELWYESRIVWKTTTAILKENANDKQLTHFRFLTSQRILLFNAYATWTMCRAGIDVVDVHPITDSYPEGPMDVVHYYGFVTYPLEQLLESLHIHSVSVSPEGHRDNHSIKVCVMG